jgi:hypothetical protein
MQLDPMEHWRRLTQHYAQISDSELLALAENLRDLTDTARQVLRDEMSKRNLGEPQSDATAGASSFSQPISVAENFAGANATGNSSGDEFIWKEVLYRCNDPELIWQISEVLRRAGIESWTDMPNKFTPMIETDMEPCFRVLVASDRIEQARAILVHPIPPDIVQQSKAEDPDYVPPLCPSCGAADPILDAVEPTTNFWKCDLCGQEWTEAAAPSE